MSIVAEGLSKKYQLCHLQQGAYATLVDSLTKGFKQLLQRKTSKALYEDFWALKDVSFSCQEGDRLGIIGKNGAGKSTLLKILSRIVEPSQGRVKIQGRVASLLEVGTGFHPELTGRENIFLNGAILGMGKREIRQKFDQIVAFAEMEKFLDTPVKYFSSGMYARLGFAIAAHLDPDILIVDEALAVGDVQFQEKCLKKLDAVSREGRTILFVSHNSAATLALCNKGLLLEKGQVKMTGSMEACLNHYLEGMQAFSLAWQGAAGDQNFHIFSLKIDHPRDFFYRDETVTLQIECEVLRPLKEEIIGFEIKNRREQTIAHSYLNQTPLMHKKLLIPGRYTLTTEIPTHLFWEGEYTLSLTYVAHKKRVLGDEISLKFPIYPAKEKEYFVDFGPMEGMCLPHSWKVYE